MIAASNNKWGGSNEGLSAKTMSMRFELNRRSGTNTERVIFREAEVSYIKDPSTQFITEMYIDVAASADNFETTTQEDIIALLETVESSTTLVSYTIGKRTKAYGKVIEFEIMEGVEQADNQVTSGQRTGVVRIVLAEVG